MSVSIFPSKNAWITPRTSETKLDDNNCQIILNQKISEVKKVLINATTVIFASYRGTGIRDNHEYIENNERKLSDFYLDEALTLRFTAADISALVVEEKKRKTLSAVNDFDTRDSSKLYQNNTFYYQQNTNIIELPNKRIGGWLIDNEIYHNVLYSLKNYLPTLYILNEGDGGRRVVKLKNYTLSPLKNNLLSAQFRIYYTPLGESVKLQVPKTNPQANQFCIPYSQQQPIVDNVTLGREMQSVANRAGCETKEVVRTCHSLSELRRPREHWGYIEKDANEKPTGNIWRLTDKIIVNSRQFSPAAT